MDAAFLCSQFDQFLVIEGNAKLCGQLFADDAAAAAKFSSDGDDSITHIGSPPFGVLCSVRIPHAYRFLYYSKNM